VADFDPAKTAEELAKLNDVKKIRAEINELSAKQLKQLIELDTATQNVKNAANEVLISLQTRVELLKDELDLANKLHENAKIRLGNQQDAVNRIDLAVKAREKELEVFRALVKAGEELTDEQKKYVDQLEDTVKGLNDSKSAADALGQSISAAFSSEHTKDFLGSLETVLQSFSNIDSMKLSLMKGTEAIGTSMINNMMGLVMAMADAENAFMKATGASEEFAGSLMDTYEATRLTGATLKDVSASYQALYTGFTDFTMIGEKQREMLGETATILNKLGVSQEAYAQGIQASTKMLGLSVAQAEANSRELVAFAKDIGVAPEAMAASFAKAGPALAKFGDQGVKAFKDLSRIAKITGMELEKVLQITDKFDTFEGAAEQAGKLNAALGGNFVNAMDLMMTTDPAERFGMIRDSILDAGLSFDEMSYYQKNFYKETLGLSDVGDLALMLSGNMDSLTGSTGKTSAQLVALKENAAKVQSLQEQWNATLAAATPMLIELSKTLGGIMGFLREWPNAMRRVLKAMMIYTVVAKGMAFANTMLAMSQTAVSATGRTAAKSMMWLTGILVLLAVVGLMIASPSKLVVAFVALAAALFVLSRVSETSVASLQALAVPLMQVGVGVLLVTGGIALMAAAFSLLNVEQLVGLGAILTAVGVGVYFLGPALTALGAAIANPYVAAGLLIFGATMLMIGGAIGIAAAGMSLMVDSLVNLTQNVDPMQFAILALSLAGFVVTLGWIGSFAPIAALGIAVLTGGIVALGLAMRVMGDPLEHLSVFMGGLSTLAANVEGLHAVRTEIVAIANAISDLDSDVTLNLSKTVTTVARTVATGGTAALSKTIAASTPAAAAAAGGEKPYEVTINFEVDGDNFGTKVITLVGGVVRDGLMGLL
jgi:hypothetical protein